MKNLEGSLVQGQHYVSFCFGPYCSDWTALNRGYCEFSDSLSTPDYKLDFQMKSSPLVFL